MWVVVYARVFLLLFLALGSAAESGDQDPNPYDSPRIAPEPVSPKSAKQFAHAYDSEMERYGREEMAPFIRAFDYAAFGFVGGLGALNFGFMESSPLTLIQGSAAVIILGSQFYVDYLFFNLDKTDGGYERVKHNLLERPEFSHFRLKPEEAIKEADRCHASFAAIANPFRRSRFLSRWAPAIAGGAVSVGFMETWDPGISVREMKRFLKRVKLIAPR
jgi:hypothetical protein